jgi:hypothetical protein
MQDFQYHAVIAAANIQAAVSYYSPKLGFNVGIL